MISWLTQLFQSDKCEEGVQYFFLHIPKTAGTLFRATLAQYFESERIVPNERLQSGFSTKGYLATEQLKEISQESFNKYQLVCGHYQYREVIDLFEKPPKLLIMLRDPPRTMHFGS